MRYRYIIIYVFTALLLIAALFCGTLEGAWDGSVTLQAEVSMDGKTEKITCWQKQGTEHILFLPSCADLSQVRFFTNTDAAVYLNGKQVADGEPFETLQLNIPYPLTYENRGKLHEFTLTILQSDHLPAMYIDVVSESMAYIHESRDHQEPGTIRTYSPEGVLDYEGNVEALKGRGSSTWNWAKKPYNLTLSQSGDLLGMGEAQRWILLANAMDDSNLRNKLIYDLAKKAGLEYSPDCQWVDLYLNGEYAGVYLLTERNEVHPQRVALEEEGSFLVSKEAEWRMDAKGQSYVMTDSSAALRIHYADLSADELLALWQSAENAILAEDGVDPVTGKHWTELIDLDSWARKFLIEEVFGNCDGGTLSQYFYRQGAGKICAGPVWDYDLALANRIAQPEPVPNSFFSIRDQLYGSKWFYALYQKEEFFTYAVSLYQAEIRPLAQALLRSEISTCAQTIRAASNMNAVRWNMADPQAEIDHICSYLTERLAFLDRIWLDGEDYLEAYVWGKDSSLNLYLLQPGDTVPGLSRYESDDTTTYFGWFHKATDQPFDPATQVWENVEVYLKYETKQ